VWLIGGSRRGNIHLLARKDLKEKTVLTTVIQNLRMERKENGMGGEKMTWTGLGGKGMGAPLCSLGKKNLKEGDIRGVKD